MRVGMLFAFLAAVSMMLGLMRWPSVHWELARAWGAAAEGDRLVLAAVFDGLNRYLGNFIGEFLGELSFSVFFVLSGVGLSRHPASAPLAQLVGYRHGRPGPDWHVAQRDAGRRRGSSGQQLSSAGMDDRLWRVACHREQNGTSDAGARLMSNLYDTIVIGAGQAGLASAYYLQRAGSRFLVLDGGSQIGESWLRRWDSLRLFTPVRYNSLPGLPFPGEPYALPVKDDVARYLEAYVAHFALPVRLNTRVSSLVRDADRFVVTTDGETFTARSVIVATGAYHRAYIPAFASALSPSLVQLHSSEYRNPDALPPGSVLVVGAGNSGAQIALELAESGRPTWLSGRDTGSIPRRVLGRDVYDWLWWTVMRPSVDSWVGRRLMGNGLFAGDPLVGFSRRALMIPTLTSVGRTVGVSNGHPRLDDGRVLEDVRTVVWCTGFRPDFRWIQLPVFGPEGYPEHRRGIVAAAPGLGFVGLRYQYRIGSSLIGGVREDAEYVVRQLASHDAHAGRASAAHITT